MGLESKDSSNPKLLEGEKRKISELKQYKIQNEIPQRNEFLKNKYICQTFN